MLPALSDVDSAARMAAEDARVARNTPSKLRWAAEHGSARNYMQAQIARVGRDALPESSAKSKWAVKFRSQQVEWNRELEASKAADLTAQAAAAAKQVAASALLEADTGPDLMKRKDWELQLRTSVRPAEQWKDSCWGRTTACDECCTALMPADAVDCKYCDVRAHATCVKMPVNSSLWICPNCVHDMRATKTELSIARLEDETEEDERRSAMILQKTIRTIRERQAFDAAKKGAIKMASILRGRVSRRRLNTHFASTNRPFKINVHSLENLLPIMPGKNLLEDHPHTLLRRAAVVVEVLKGNAQLTQMFRFKTKVSCALRIERPHPCLRWLVQLPGSWQNSESSVR
jgi:hypothetical protein